MVVDGEGLRDGQVGSVAKTSPSNAGGVDLVS